VLQLLLQRQLPLSLANGWSQPNSDVDDCWVPIWQWLHAVGVDETRDDATRSQALDVLLLLALARGSVFMLYHLLSALLASESAPLSISSASLLGFVEFTRSIDETGGDKDEEEIGLEKRMALVDGLPATSAAVIIAAQMQRLAQSVDFLPRAHPDAWLQPLVCVPCGWRCC
jgi:hypothetical protein